MSGELLFVYGSLRSDVKSSWQVLMAGAQHLGYAYVQGRLYAMADYPGLIASACKKAHVTGELYQICDEGLLSRLDEYEECTAAYPAPQAYQRQYWPVYFSGVWVWAWVYVYQLETAQLPLILSGDYRQWQQHNEML